MSRLKRKTLIALLQEARTALDRGLAWWLSEIRVLKLQRFLGIFTEHSERLKVFVCENVIAIRDEEGGEVISLPRGSGQVLSEPIRARVLQAELTLVLPKAQVLRRLTKLPLAASRDIGGASSFLIDRQTPFHLDQVVYACRVAGRDAMRGRLEVELAVVQRYVIDYALGAADSAHLPLSAVAIEDDNGQPAFDLLPPDRRRRRLSWRREPWKLVLAGSGVVLIAGILLVGTLIHARAGALEALVATQKANGAQIEALHAELASAVTASRFIPKKQELPRMIEVLSTLTRTIGNDCWVFGLDISDNKMKLAGFCADVPKLIQQLQAQPGFGDSELTSPLARSPSGNRDRFELLVSLKRGGDS